MTVSAGQALEVLSQGWEMQKNHGIKLSYMMHGRPGIGKTQLAEELARRIGGKLYDMRLTTIEPSDLRGMPHYDHENKLTVWYRPEDLPDTDEPAVLFFDEITAAPPFIQPTAYGILQERRIGQHRIHDNTIIVCAGNTVDDGAIAYEMGTAIADRLVHMLVEADPKDWIENYAIPKKLHPAVISFIQTRPDFFETTQEALNETNMIAATPRSWERVSDIMYHISDPLIRNIMIAGTVGSHIQAEFAIIADDIAATVKVTDMIKVSRKERIEMFPTSMHGLHAMVYGLLGMVNAENADATIEILVDLGRLKELRPEAPEFKKIPLKELSTHGFESLIGTLIDNGLHQVILDNEAYQDYNAEREAAGLAKAV
jgi:SpoVK/Ycf46/Vps4 family AAA+-type ATPase